MNSEIIGSSRFGRRQGKHVNERELIYISITINVTTLFISRLLCLLIVYTYWVWYQTNLLASLNYFAYNSVCLLIIFLFLIARRENNVNGLRILL